MDDFKMAGLYLCSRAKEGKVVVLSALMTTGQWLKCLNSWCSIFSPLFFFSLYPNTHCYIGESDRTGSVAGPV